MKNNLLHTVTFLLTASATLLGDVWPVITYPTAESKTSHSVKITNNTNNSWTLGGARWMNHGWECVKIPEQMQESWFTVLNIPQDSLNEVNLYFKSNAPKNNYAKLAPNSSQYFNHTLIFPWGTPQDTIDKTIVVEGSEFLLLRTGSKGLAENPEGEKAITLEELDSISRTADYYNKSYRPEVYDSLGVRGGPFSGGLFDTWLGETQGQLAIPESGLMISNTLMNIDKSPTLYWIAGFVAQEYLDVDMQVLVAQGAKETFSGTSFFQQEYLNGTEFTSYHIEAPSALDRALTYPQFFPHYESQLASAPDVITSGIDYSEFMKYYTRAKYGTTILNSATAINGAIFTSLFRLQAYDMLSTATDICWKEGLEASSLDPAGDPYTGLGAILKAYVNGMWGSMGQIASVYGADFDASAVDRLSFGAGNNNYVPENFKLMQTFIDASRQSLTDSTIEILDMPITREEMLSVYFGDNGSVETQGDGGLLRHFIGSNTGTRQLIWDKINGGFDILKGRAPGVGSEEISLRYDLLSLLRVVKGDISFNRQFRIASDAATLIPQYSTGNVNCDGAELDEMYPYITTTSTYELSTEEFIVTIDGVDETAMKSAQWTIDYNWGNWVSAVEINRVGSKEATFEARVPKASIDAFKAVGDGKSGFFMWAMVSDSSGNSTVAKIPVEVIEPKYPSVDSAGAYDTDGDGMADKIELFFTPGGADDADAISTISNVKYSWPTKEDFSTPNAVTNNGSTVTLVEWGYLSGGAGIGEVTFDYPSLKGYSHEIRDRVGPALTKTALLKDGDKDRDRDTLAFTVTEALAGSLENTYAYLAFAKDSAGTVNVELSQTLTKLTSNQYYAIFGRNDISKTDYKWVKLISSNGAPDVEGNLPAENSQWIPLLFEKETAILQKDSTLYTKKGEVRMYPNPVSATEDEVNIITPCYRSGSWSIRIYDHLGNLIDSQEFTSDGGTYSWDLRNTQGQKVSAGTYVVVVSVETKGGTKKQFKKVIGVKE